MDEIEEQRYKEASKCDGCVNWLKHCNAECCKQIIISMNPKHFKAEGKYLTVDPGKKLGLSDIKYYKLHDVEYLRGVLRFRSDRIFVKGNILVYKYECQYLKDNLCIGHPHNKPDVCKSLTLETAKLPEQNFVLTDNCLFKYKAREVDNE